MTDTTADTVLAGITDALAAVLALRGETRADYPLALALAPGGYGLDSLDMAVFSVELERRFGTDPYSALRFPLTLADVVAFYRDGAA